MQATRIEKDLACPLAALLSRKAGEGSHLLEIENIELKPKV